MIKSNQKNSHKGQKIVAIIIAGLFALMLITQLWLLYILVGTVVLSVYLNRRDETMHTDAVKPKTSYWQRKESKELIIALTILCPPAGLVVISRHHKPWMKKTTTALPVVLWMLAWFLLLGFATHLTTKYTHQAYKSNVSVVDLSKYDEQVKNSGVAIPETSTESVGDSDNVRNNTNTQDSSNSGPASPQAQSQQSNDVMSGIKMAEPESVPYDRNLYQPNWSAGGGCDIRSRVLTAASIVTIAYGSNGCTVMHGSWNEPYTGTVFTGNPYRGDDGTANDLDIDHIIPLNYVNSHGGYHWPSSQKRTYGASLTAMNNGVYIAASASENRKKGDKGPSAYYPPNPAYKCTYSEKWRNTARTYSISLSPADYKLIASILVGCGVN